MLVYVIYNQTLSGVVQVNPPPDPIKYFGQTYVLFGTNSGDSELKVPNTTNTIIGNGSTWASPGSSTSHKLRARHINRLIYLGLFNAGTHSWVYEQ